MTESLNIKWSAQKKFIFLFVLSYTFFYILPFPIDAFQQLSFIFNRYDRAIDKLVIFIWEHILHLHNAKKHLFSDSGDTTLDFAKFFIFFFFSIVSAITVFIIDKKRINYEKAQYYLFIYIRYCIGFYLLVYGFDKVFKSHFPFPSLEKLEQPFGESSPQGLLWAFMGYSTTYSLYLGIIEVASGFLLFFRRTTALGALLSLMIMINVTIINFSYDVPVKLFALHMVAYSLLLLSPFFNSLFQFFVLQKVSQLPQQTEFIFPKFIQSYIKIIKAVVIISYTALFMSFSITNMNSDGDNAPKPALYGIYKQTMFNPDNSRKPLDLTNSIRFDKILFDKKNTIVISTDENISYYTTIIDTLKHTIDFKQNGSLNTFRLNYTNTENYLVLEGLIGKDSVRMNFNKQDMSEFPLISREFHWVVEYPENY